MIAIPKTIVKGLTLPLLAILLSSCATNSNVRLPPDYSTWEAVDGADSYSSDTELEDIDSKVCLDEELAALNQTGTWDEQSSSETFSLSDSVQYDFPVVMNNKVNMYLNLFQNEQREQFRHWLARSAMYQPMIEKELEQAGLPKDLIYLAMIESGYNQLACSRAKAVGLWQFMQETGKQYDLHVNQYVDERRDPLKSTQAAVAYLSELYNEFDDWYLAVAAYNGGPGTIRNGLKKHNVDNFWDLAGKNHLSLETKRYVPKLIAALLIARDPEKYGFTDINYQEPLRYDTLTVGPGMSLETIALISNSTAREIQRLNQELKLGKTPPNTAHYEVKIPEATAAVASKNLSRLRSVVSTGYQTHIVRRGETLAKISDRYDVNKATILKVNGLRGKRLASGRKLKIPYNTVKYQLLAKGSSAAESVDDDNLILHRIKPGETVVGIARRYDVSPGMIVSWNGLKNPRTIKAGQQLALYLDQGDTAEEEQDKNSITSFTVEEEKTKLQQPAAPYERYSIQDGDSLWTISKKYSASTDQIKKWNTLTSDQLQPGSVLKVKKV